MNYHQLSIIDNSWPNYGYGCNCSSEACIEGVVQFGGKTRKILTLRMSVDCFVSFSSLFEEVLAQDPAEFENLVQILKDKW